MNIGSYLRALDRVLSSYSGQRAWGEDYRQVGQGWVHRSARLDASARIASASLIGSAVALGRETVIMGATIIGPDSRVEAGAILSNVVAWSGCRIGPGAILNNCLLLPGSCVEGGVVVRDAICSSDDVVSISLVELAAEYWTMPSKAGAGPVARAAAVEELPAAPAWRPSVSFGPIARS